MRAVGTALLATLLLAACDRGADDPAAFAVSGQPTEVTYADRLNVELARMNRSDTGLYYEDLQGGTGQTAHPGMSVVAHYTGWLVDGTEFDSSRGADPIEFPLGAGAVIPGWDEGLAGMQVGGQRRLVIPPDLAYGEQGARGIIPPNATLVFDVELVDVR